MPLSGPEIILYEKKDHIVTITLNRPERMNATTPETFGRLDDAWQKFQQDDDAFVAIWTATGDKAFCAGNDLKEQAARVAEDPDFDIVKLVPGVILGTAGTPYGNNVTKPVVGAINGIATAGGFEFSMMCDLKVAAYHASFGVGEVKVGRGTPWAIPVLWQMPLPMAFEVLLMGNPVPAQRLYDVGWINRVVPMEQLMPTAIEMASILATNAPLSVRAAKEVLYNAMDVGRKTGLDMAKLVYEKVYASEDAIEGPLAFSEKRKPIWKGR